MLRRKPSSKNNIDIHRSMTKFWLLHDSRQSVNISIRIVGTNFLHDDVRKCTVLGVIPEFASNFKETIGSQRLRRLLGAGIEYSEEFGGIMYVTDWSMNKKHTNIVIQTVLGGTDYILKQLLERRSEVIYARSIDDRTISVKISNDAKLFCNILSQYGIRPMTDIRPTTDRKERLFEKGILYGKPDDLKAATTEIHCQTNMLLSSTYEGSSEIEVDQCLIKNPLIMKALGLSIFDPKGEQRLGVGRSHENVPLSIWKTRKRPKYPLRETVFVKEKVEEFTMVFYFLLSGLSKIPYKNIVTEDLERNGVTISGHRIHTSKFREMLYRAQRLSAFLGFSEEDREKMFQRRVLKYEPSFR